MRHVPLKICGEELDLPISFEAGEKLEKAGYDPLRTALRQNRGEIALSSQGVIVVLAIGAKCAGSKLKREEIGQAVFDAGVNAYLGVAIDYLAAFVMAEPEFPIAADEKKAGAE